MKTITRALFAGALSVALTCQFVYADTTPPPSLISVNVPDHCTVVDIDSVSHTFSTGQYLGICALAAAKDQGAVDSYTLQNFSFGLFLQTLNGTTPGTTQFWSLLQNGAEAQVGLADLNVAVGDIITFKLVDWTDNSVSGTPVSFKIGSLLVTPTVSMTRSNGGGLTLHDPFNVPLAVDFVWHNQGPDGSFGNELLNDWIAIAANAQYAGEIQKHLSAFLRGHQPQLASVTDFERHAMALEAVGIDPYIGTGVDYITPIVAAFDGTQVGDTSLINDDIFAIFPLLHAGYASDDTMLKQIGSHIVAMQMEDGSWASSVDMTAAGIQALDLLPGVASSSDSISRALKYLRDEQDQDGGFGNSQTTSWVLQAIFSQEQTPYDWVKNTYLMPDYALATKQQYDGGVESLTTDVDTRLWATAYALPAAARKTWDQLLSSFPKPTPVQPLVDTTPIEATTTTPIATTTPAFEVTVNVEPAPIETPVMTQMETTPEQPAAVVETPEEQAPAPVVTSSQTAAAAAVSPLPDWVWYILALLIVAFGYGAYERRSRS